MLFQVLHHSSLEIQVLACDATYFISHNVQEIPASFLKSAITELLPLSKEKNTSLKYAAEIALVSLLKSGHNQAHIQVCSLPIHVCVD